MRDRIRWDLWMLFLRFLFPILRFLFLKVRDLGDVHEGLLKFALIRFFDGSGLQLAGKMAVVMGWFLEVMLI
ncbi:hypothetical protein [Kaistella sp.]|uniref:hypothetical protein n=1 Tax=Kaistella sp. TaxID=2782235 RepID=UPI003C373743